MGVKENKGKALKLFLDLANSGNSDAALSLAYNALVSDKNLDETFRWLNRSSELGNKRAENFSNYLLSGAGLYNFGISRPSMDADKLALVEKKAKEGDSASRILLGGFYEDNKDYDSAFYWYKKAAESGHSAAQLMLGMCYYYGRGVAQDYNRDFECFLKAEGSANFWLAKCYYYGHGSAQNFKKAFELFKETEKSVPENMENKLLLGKCYYYGRGVEADIKKAVSYFSEAAEYFLPEGEYWPASCLFKGEGVERDLVKAYTLFKMAAMQGNKKACEKLALF